jgi:hypothetical protein
MSTSLPPIIEEHIAAVNAGDLDALAATFADDAYIATQADARGPDAIRALLAKEFINDHVTLEVREVTEHHGDYIVRTKYDGTYPKDNLPDPLIMTNYFAVLDDKIVTVAVIFIPPTDAALSEQP